MVFWSLIVDLIATRQRLPGAMSATTGSLADRWLWNVEFLFSIVDLRATRQCLPGAVCAMSGPFVERNDWRLNSAGFMRFFFQAHVTAGLWSYVETWWFN